MNTTESLKDYQRVRSLAIRSLFEIIEQSSEGTVIVDRDANIVWMNERYAGASVLNRRQVRSANPVRA
jgi:transcriptional regulator with PAS, ATPase and Fis domain